MSEVSSRRPYLIRALYDWVMDNDLTPHLLVAADADGVNVPRQYVTEDGRITINISPNAVQGLSLGNDWITLSARFSGRSYAIDIPPGAVLALYARENGEGMLFGEVEQRPQEESAADVAERQDSSREADGPDKPRTAHLRVIQ